MKAKEPIQSLPQKIMLLDEYFEAGLPPAFGHPVSRVRFDGARRRVVFEYEDPDGQVRELICRHRLGNLTLSTLKMAEGFRWARRQIFSVKDNR